MNKLIDKVSELIAEREAQSNLRRLDNTNSVATTTVLINGRELINFASNDYLGLSSHPFLKEQAIKAIERFGVGLPSSRFISGNSELYGDIEFKLAQLKGTEAALIFPTGFQTNFTVLQALSKLDSLFYCDQLSHNSILIGSQMGSRHFKRFKHNDISELKEALSKQSSQNKWIVTESVFSMDGDLAPIESLVQLRDETKSWLYLDEAHATGVFGKNGMGLLDNPDDQTIVMGTFGKSCGSFGAYIACSNIIKEYLVNFCAGLIYTTALPPSVLGTINAALDIIPHMVSERKTLLDNAAILTNELKNIGFDTGQSASQIICLHLGNNELALSLSEYLAENGIYARAIRPPTVPAKTARIRLSLSLAHSNLEIEYLIKTLKRWYANKY
jgi:8-amino-7-oxononanoate synthase